MIIIFLVDATLAASLDFSFSGMSLRAGIQQVIEQ